MFDAALDDIKVFRHLKPCMPHEWISLKPQSILGRSHVEYNECKQDRQVKYCCLP